MCERFRFDVGLQTVNVYYTQIVTGSGITQSAAVPTYRFLVTKVDQQFPTPVFTDLQESLQARVESGSAFQQRLEYFQINCSSPATAVQEVSTAGMITSVGARVSGQCAVFFEAGVWNQNPYCVGVNSNISAGAGSFTGLEITTNNLTQVTIQGLDGNTPNEDVANRSRARSAMTSQGLMLGDTGSATHYPQYQGQLIVPTLRLAKS
jgi:hypothetical protein